MVTAVDTAMVQTYWQIGRLIVEDEQQGKARAEYGKGFDVTNLRYMRLVYLAFPNCDTLCHNLSWSHYRVLSKIENEQARRWYMNEASEQHWSVRALERQIGKLYYERLLTTQAKQQDISPVVEEVELQQALEKQIRLNRQALLSNQEDKQ